MSLGTITVPIASGVYGNSNAVSCVATAAYSSTGRLSHSYYRVDAVAEFVINDDLTATLRIVSGTGGQSGMSNATSSGGQGAPFFFNGMYAYPSEFNTTINSSGVSMPEGVLKISGDTLITDDWSSGTTSHHNQSFNIPAGSQVNIGSILNLKHSNDFETYYFYVSGPVTFDSPVTDPVTYPAYEIAMSRNGNPWFSDFLKYYPWERMISSEWYSLNRSGGPSVQTNDGLFRKENGIWQPVYNENASTGEANGFRYNNGWKKSPKSGKGA